MGNTNIFSRCQKEIITCTQKISKLEPNHHSNQHYKVELSEQTIYFVNSILYLFVT